MMPILTRDRTNNNVLLFFWLYHVYPNNTLGNNQRIETVITALGNFYTHQVVPKESSAQVYAYPIIK